MQAKIQQVLIILSNIHGLNCNSDSVHQFSQCSLLGLLLNKTHISLSSDITRLQLPNYTFNSSFVLKVGVLLSAVARRLPNLDFFNGEFQIMWLKLRFPSFNYCFCVVYRSLRSADCSIFDLIPSSIEILISTDPRSSVPISEDFNVHNCHWLRHSLDTSIMGREAEQLGVINNLSQPIDLTYSRPNC